MLGTALKERTTPLLTKLFAVISGYFPLVVEIALVPDNNSRNLVHPTAAEDLGVEHLNCLKTLFVYNRINQNVSVNSYRVMCLENALSILGFFEGLLNHKKKSIFIIFDILLHQQSL